jgi:hypothetical protein
VTINASRREKLGIKTGDTVEVFNDRGKCVVPAYVTERCMPGVAGAARGRLDGSRREGHRPLAGNPDFLTLDEPSPAGAFAYNTCWCNIRKTEPEHRPGWDRACDRAQFHVFRRDDCKDRRRQPWPRPQGITSKRKIKDAVKRKKREVYEPVKPDSSSASSTTTSTASAAVRARSPARTRTACRPARASAV